MAMALATRPLMGAAETVGAALVADLDTLDVDAVGLTEPGFAEPDAGDADFDATDFDDPVPAVGFATLAAWIADLAEGLPAVVFTPCPAGCGATLGAAEASFPAVFVDVGDFFMDADFNGADFLPAAFLVACAADAPFC